MNDKIQVRIIRLLPLLIIILVLLRTAWIGDDAYITMRTVDNFVHGYGLTWNISERVQAYTHPFWLFLISGIYFPTHDAYFSLLILSFAFSIGTVALLCMKIARTPIIAILGGTFLFSSKAFIDYSTSGLENPLSHFLIILFIYVGLIDQKIKPKPKATIMGLIVAFIGLTRLDLLLLVLPFFIWRLRREGKEVIRTGIFAMILPLLAWEVFSIIYYGFPIPNTAFAKLNQGISKVDLIEQGVYYLFNSILWDPATLLVIILGVFLSFSNRDRGGYMIAIGTLVYLCYVVWIGGDFMSGRFLSCMLVINVAVILVLVEAYRDNVNIFLIIAILLTSFLSPKSLLFEAMDLPSSTSVQIDIFGIADEQFFYQGLTGLSNIKMNSRPPYGEWADAGIQTRNQGGGVFVRGSSGFFGYLAGPDTFIIDKYALSDALLSRLPTVDKREWRIGHFTRSIPEGYIQSIEAGENLIADDNLSTYYDALSKVIKGEIWSLDRFVEIWRLNTGWYDDLLRAYISSQ